MLIEVASNKIKKNVNLPSLGHRGSGDNVYEKERQSG
jgi:hypothetical protein